MSLTHLADPTLLPMLLAKLALASHGQTLPPVFWLYVLNTVSVGGNLLLQWRMGRRRAAPVAPNGLTTAG